MRKICFLFAALISVPLCSYSEEVSGKVIAMADGWEVTAVPAQRSLRLTHTRLGTLLENIRLNLSSEHGMVEPQSWLAESTAPGVLRIQTTQPASTWTMELKVDSLAIFSTRSDGVLTAQAPAGETRQVARLLDPRGSPVTWSGTAEVANGYDGAETRNASSLSQSNPDVMYFSLGQISGNAFHSLFDRKTDTAIDFSNSTRLQRSLSSKDLLSVTIPVPGNTVIRLIPDYYTKTLGVPYYAVFDDSLFPKAPAVWSSWTGYYAEVTEKDVVSNADWLADHLKPYGFDYVQLDDGYDRGKTGEHYWIENWDRAKFPHGPQWLTENIKSKGLKAGIWLVPNAYAGAVEQHPDWYVRDRRGKVILDYNTPTLDSTNPEVDGFLKRLFTTLDGWGFEYYKFDGEHAFSKYVPSVDRSKLHDTSADPLVTYRNRLKLIRETVGPRTFIEGCPAGTPLNGIQYFNSYFNGDDVYNSWQGMYPLFSSINANAFLNHQVVYVMPGEGIDVSPSMTVAEAKQKRNATFSHVASTREKPLAGFGTTLAEARTLVSYVALTGVVYPLASILPELPEERIKLLQMTLPTMPILPVDLFSRGTDMTWDKFRHEKPDSYLHNYPEILDLKVSATSGTYDVIGVTNWRSEPLHRGISFADKLGLPAGRRYAVFDYWRQQYLGVFDGQIDIDVEPHDTRVLSVHPVGGDPQLIGTSRHITGAYSIEELAWDGSKSLLKGSSETISGERYTLTFFVPTSLKVSAIRATDDAGHQVAPESRAVHDSLSISFQGPFKNVNWSVGFTR